jgi:hypothetical protein
VGDKLQKPNRSADEVAALIEKAQDGDDGAYTELREYVGDNPRFWNRIGNLAAAAELQWLQKIISKDRLTQEGVKRRLQSMKRDLLASGRSPLERLLVDRIAVCWLQVQYADAWYPHKLEEGMTFEAGDYYQRRQDRAHRRFLSAIKALATVRKLALPVLQVNIADQQVNLATGAPPSADERS